MRNVHRDFGATIMIVLVLTALAAGSAEAQIVGTNHSIGAFTRPILGDVDNDGNLDILAVADATGMGDIFVNQGNGTPGNPPTFVASGQSLPVSGYYGAGRLGDLNGDGHLDIFTVPDPYFNDGTGTFTSSGQSLGGVGGFVPDMDLVDLDGDGDLDAVSFDRHSGPYIYENQNNTGIFTLVHTITSPTAADGWSTAVAADMNGDQYLDLVLHAARYGGGYVMLNDGSNAFTLHHTDPTINFNARGAGAGDLDGDGNADWMNLSTRLISDGANPPSFTATTISPSFDGQSQFFDLDLDGDLDLVKRSITYLNDGSGNFPSSVGYVGVSRLDIGDIVGDGVPELVGEGNAITFIGITPPNDCPDPADVDYGGFTAANCAGSVVKARDQAALDAYLADFGVGGGSKPKHLNVLFQPTGNVEIVSPCRIKVLGVSKLIDVAANRFCVYGRAGVTIGAGTPAAGSLIDADAGDVLLVSEEGRVQSKPGMSYISGDMDLEAEQDADVGSDSTIDVMGPLGVTSASGQAMIQSGSDVTVDSLTMSADQAARIGDGSTVDVSGDLAMTSTSSGAEIQQSSMVTVGGGLDLSGFSCQIAGLAGVDVTGTATLAASGSATASDAEILSGATLTAADISQTAEHKAVLSGGATVDAGAGNAEIEAPVCVVAGTVIAGSTSGSCLP